MTLYCHSKRITAIINAMLVLPDKLKGRWWLSQLLPLATQGFWMRISREVWGEQTVLRSFTDVEKREVLNWLKLFRFELNVQQRVPEEVIIYTPDAKTGRNQVRIGAQSGYWVAIL